MSKFLNMLRSGNNSRYNTSPMPQITQPKNIVSKRARLISVLKQIISTLAGTEGGLTKDELSKINLDTLTDDQLREILQKIKSITNKDN